MQDTRKWIASGYILPQNNQKVYYFCDFLGIFRGEYFYDNTSKSNPHKFCSEHGILDGDDISYWMPYDHRLKDMIPLPPDYKKVDIHSVQSIINNGEDFTYEEVKIPDSQQQFSFTFIQSGDN